MSACPGRLSRLLALSVALILAGLAVAPAGARVVISISPSLVEMEANPGAEAIQEITVFNEGDERFRVRPLIEQYGPGGRWSMVEWIELLDTEFDLDPGERQVVRYRLKVPPSATPGGHYAMIYFQTAGAGVNSSGMVLSGKVGTGLLLTVPEQLERRLAITRLLPSLESSGRYTLDVLTQNRGNVHVVPSGAIEILGTDGGRVVETALDPAVPLLPDVERGYPASDQVALSPATYTARATLHYGGAEPARAELTFSSVPHLALDRLEIVEDTQRQARLTLRNDGDVRLSPTGALFAVNSAGERLAPIPLPRMDGLLPGASTTVQIPLQARLNPGAYRFEARVDYGAAGPAVLATDVRLGPAEASSAAQSNPDWPSAPAPAFTQPSPPGLDSGLLWLAVGLGALLVLASFGMALLFIRLRAAQRATGAGGS